MKTQHILVSVALLALSACEQRNTMSFSKDASTSQWSPKGDSIRLAVVGDSLAAGLLANTSIVQDNAKDSVVNFIGTILSLTSLTKSNKALTPLETSIEMDRLFAKTDESALAGTQSYSLATQLQDKFGKTVEKVRQYSISGARTWSLQPQLDAMKADYQTKNIVPADVVVLHVGGNDWCENRPSSEFETDLHQNVKSVMELNPNAQILVLPVPDLVSVMSVADKSSDPSLSCVQIRQTTNTCMKRGIKMGASESDVAAQRQSLNGYNQIVSKVVSKVSTEVPGFTGKVAAGTFYGQKTEFRFEWLAVDCFHPGSRGQEVIGELAGKDLSALLGN